MTALPNPFGDINQLLEFTGEQSPSQPPVKAAAPAAPPTSPTRRPPFTPDMDALWRDIAGSHPLPPVEPLRTDVFLELLELAKASARLIK